MSNTSPIRRLALACATILALSACTSMRPLPLAAPGVTRGGWASLTVRPHFVGTVGRQAQAAVAEKTPSDIHRLDIVPFVETGTSLFEPLNAVTGEATTLADEHLLRISQTGTVSFEVPVTFEHLRPNKRYRIFAMAYDVDGVLISTTDAYSYVQIDLTNDNRPQLPETLPVRLTPNDFSGTAIADYSMVGSDRGTALKLRLSTTVDNTDLLVATASIARSDLPHRFTFSHLRADTTYRVDAVPVDADAIELATHSTTYSVAHDNDLGAASVSVNVPWTVTTIAGNDTAATVDGVGTAASLNRPDSVAFDAQGTLYWSEVEGPVIRRMTSDGAVTTFAGTPGEAGLVDGDRATARLSSPMMLTADPAGNLYFYEQNDNVIRKVASDGSVTTLAGSVGVWAPQDGTGSNASFGNVGGLTFSPADGNLYLSDNLSSEHYLRKITPSGEVTTLSTPVANPQGIKADAAGNLYFVDDNPDGRQILRRMAVDESGLVTLAGGGDQLPDVTSASECNLDGYTTLAVAPDGSVFLANPDTILQVRDGSVQFIAGGGMSEQLDGVGTGASFYTIYGLTADDQGRLIVADFNHQRIRMAH